MAHDPHPPDYQNLDSDRLVIYFHDPVPFQTDYLNLKVRFEYPNKSSTAHKAHEGNPSDSRCCHRKYDYHYENPQGEENYGHEGY